MASATTAQRLLPCALRALGLLVIMATAGQSVQAASEVEPRFKQIRPQFIAALGDPGASSGGGAQAWGVWRLDPGPRGVWLRHSTSQLKRPVESHRLDGNSMKRTGGWKKNA